MHKDTMRFRKIPFEICAALLSALYLTFLVDTYTLNTVPKRVFVFCYFLVMCLTAVFLRRKLTKGKAQRKGALAAAGILAALIIVLGHSVFFPSAKETTVSLSALPCEDGSYHEVWFTSLQVDGQETQLSNLEVDAVRGWIYDRGGDDYVYYPGEDNGENYLTFKVTGQAVDLYFGQNAWSGVVNIWVDGAAGDTLLLASEDNSSVDYTVNAVRHYAVWEYILYGLGAWVVIWFFIRVLLALFTRWAGLRLNWTRRQTMIALLVIAATAVLFFTSEKIHPTTLTRIFLVLLTIVAIAKLNTPKRGTFMEKYCAKSCYWAIGLISLYASFASFGQRFFLDGNTRMHFSLPGTLYLLCGVLWFVPVIWLLLYGLEKLSCEERKLPRTDGRRKAWWILFGSLAVCQVVVLCILWPGGFANDSIVQLSQALGLYGYNDWHPLLHTLLERVILVVFHQAGMITAVQMLLFTLLLTSFLWLGYERGVSLRKLIVTGCLFQLLPNQALSWSNVLKDFPFTLALLWGLYLLALLALDMPQSRKLYFWALLALDMFLIMGLRHNGIVPAAVMMVLCVVLTLRNYQKFRLRAAAAVMAALAAFAILKGPVFQALQVGTNGMSPYTTMLMAVASCINKDLPLSDEANAIMEEVLPLEDWRDYYSRYYGHDPYFWGRPAGSVPYDTSGVTMSKAFRVYLEALVNYPDVVIKDRLDGMDIMWDVVQPPDSFNAKSFDHVYSFGAEHMAHIPISLNGLIQQADGTYIKETFLAKAYSSCKNTPLNSAADMLLWRTGAYLIAFLALVVFWWKNRLGKLLWAAIPMLGNVAASMLVLYHQSFRYVYFIQPSVLALIFLSVLFKEKMQHPPQKTRKTVKTK